MIVNIDLRSLIKVEKLVLLNEHLLLILHIFVVGLVMSFIVSLRLDEGE
jgi:hypothetical protein